MKLSSIICTCIHKYIHRLLAASTGVASQSVLKTLKRFYSKRSNVRDAEETRKDAEKLERRPETHSVTIHILKQVAVVIRVLDY